MMFERFNAFAYILFMLIVPLPTCMGAYSDFQDSSSGSRVGLNKTSEKINKMKEALITLFYRPFEPVFLPKGPNNSVFIIPDHYWVDRYKHVATELEEVYESYRKLGVDIKERIMVKDLGDRVLSLGDALSVSQDTLFMTFIVNSQQSVMPIVTALLDASSLEDLLSLAVYVRDRINPYIFIHILLMVILHRPDTSGMSVPSLTEAIPELLIDTNTLGRAMQETFVTPTRLQMPVSVPLEFVTSSELDEEQGLAHFREDIAVNLQHKHWHIAYANLSQYNKDRRGELFFYFHEQIMARYNFERLCNGLLRTLPLDNFREPIKEGYFPKLHCPGGLRDVPGRFPYTPMSDVIRKKDNITVLVKTVEEWRDRIYEAINNGHLISSEGKVVALDEREGIDLLSNLVESNYKSVNSLYYGDLHNTGHVVLGFAHDPMGVFKEPEGPMGRDFGISMKDPVFYRWHGFLNNIYFKFKHSLPGYREDELQFQGVQIRSVEIRSIGSDQKNALYTMWQQTDLDISQGINFALPGRPTVVLLNYLQHQPFSYEIQVENLGKAKKGICRIYLGPKFENGILLPFKEQKNLFIEMDRFIVDLKNGMNTITRKSEDTVVTIPYEMTFGKANALKTDNISYDRCGWPHHMLLPKGTAEGFPSLLFVMISDYENDKIEDSITFGEPNLFKKGGTMCGQRGKYPDKRPMLYPFDRMPSVDSLEEFLTPNMIVSDVSIYHFNKTVIGSTLSELDLHN